MNRGDNTPSKKNEQYILKRSKDFFKKDQKTLIFLKL